MKDNVALIIDTNSNYSDVWEPCFGRLDRYAKGFKKYAFTDTAEGIPSDMTPVIYDNDETYRNQFLSCIEQIEEKYIVYTSEDYLLYDFVKQDLIENLTEILDETDYNFCKLIKGPEKVEPYDTNIFIIDTQDKNFFEKVFTTAPSTNGRMEHEPQGSSICRSLGFKGLQYYCGSPKRGSAHYDSVIYPYIATAVVKGQWNLSEYPSEMGEIIKEFKIDCRTRGWR